MALKSPDCHSHRLTKLNLNTSSFFSRIPRVNPFLYTRSLIAKNRLVRAKLVPAKTGNGFKKFCTTNVDGLVKSPKMRFPVIPAEAGIQLFQYVLDPGFRRGDDLRDFLRIHQRSKSTFF